MTIREQHTPAGVYTIIRDEWGEMSILGDIAEARRDLIRRAMRLERDAARIEAAMDPRRGAQAPDARRHHRLHRPRWTATDLPGEHTMPRYAVSIRTCTWTTHHVEAETPEDACEEAMTADGTDEYSEFDGISQIIELDPDSDTEGTDHPIPADWIR